MQAVPPFPHPEERLTLCAAPDPTHGHMRYTRGMAFLLTMHARLVITITVVFLALAIWGLVAFLRGRPVAQRYRAGLWIGWLLLLAEALIGVALLAAGRRAYRQELHLIYGAVAVLTLPAAALYLRRRSPRWTPLALAGVCLFLCGIALRALATGRAPGG